MPEGHTTHRLAREHRRELAGRTVAVSSPQGRFAAGAARLDGRVLDDVDAHGKHLFYRWRGEPEAPTLHVHLGLVGTFRTHRGVAAAPTANTRLVMQAGDLAVHLAGPLACELLDPGEEERIRARLGPDPLRRDADRDAAYAALRRRRAPVGAALLDQKVVAGIGNVFRAEALFVCGLDPARPADTLERDEFDALWDTLTAMLRKGVRQGRIVTAGRDGRYVYRRAGEPCLRCGTTIVGSTVAGRTLFSCPGCQGGG